MLKQEAQIRAGVKANEAMVAFKHTDPKVRFPKVEEVLEIWLDEVKDSGLVITGEAIKIKAQEFAQGLGIDENKIKFSNGWLSRFKDRQNLKQVICHGEAASVSPADVALARAEAQEALKGYAPCDIYNMDETGLFFSMPPDRTLASQQMSGTKADKERITVAFCANADGSDIRKPLFIGRAKQPRAFKSLSYKHYGLYYFYNTSAWMQTSIFQMCADCNSNSKIHH